MSIADQYVPVKISWTGAYAVMSFPYESIGPSAIEVWFETQTATAGVYTRQLVPVQYYTLLLTGQAPIYSGAILAFNPGYVVPATVTRLSLERNTPITQTCDFANFSPFQMDLIEFSGDKLTMIIQEIAYRKCNVAVTQPIEQLLTFNPQDVLYGSMVKSLLDKITAYCLQMKTSGQDCTNNLGET